MHLQSVIENQEKIAEIKYLPSVLVILPFKPTTTLKTALQYSLKKVLVEIEQQLLGLYSTERCFPIIIKLRSLLRNLNYNTHKKSIALFVSPVVEKVYYLEVEEEKKIAIDEPFEIRDLVNSKMPLKKYLVMLLNNDHSKMYYFNGIELTLIKYNVIINTKSYKRTHIDKFQEQTSVNNHEILLAEFLHQMDQGLSIILKSYKVPIFTMGSNTILEKFKYVSVHSNKIVEFIEGNFQEVSIQEIQEVLLPYTDHWQKIKQRHLLNQIESAEAENKLIVGLDNVWRAVKQNTEMLLMVEPNYARSTEEWKMESEDCRMDSLSEKAFYLKDEVEEIIEKVLENGGDVEFAERGMLKKYHHIVLLPGD